MRVDLEWLKEYVDLEAGHEELASRLTMAGVEVEGCQTGGGRTVLEVSVTPNRGDCLSMTGLAREIRALTGASLILPDVHVAEMEEKNPIQVKLENSRDCPRYAARYISDVKIGPSPDWMKQRLETCGIRSINNIVDITNYVLLEFGHPLHPFDADTVCDKTIVVRSAHPGEALVTLDGIERQLSSDMLVIADREKALALAGVMGGQATEVGEGTCNILLESAYFQPPSIRKTSRRLGLTTEASYRFERGCDPDNVIRALDRAAGLIQQMAGGKVHGGVVDSYPEPVLPTEITLRFARLHQILGLKISPEDALDILKRLGFVVSRVGDKEALLVSPLFRSDLTREIDLIEEVARIYGYERIPATLPSGATNSVPKDKYFDQVDRAKMFMATLGFFEGINFTFTNESDFSKLNSGFPEGVFLKLKNPLNVGQDVLRISLIGSLLENLARNFRWNQPDVKLFEISTCYVPVNGSFKEKRLLAGVMAGRRNVEYWKDDESVLDFYDVKGVVEALLGEFGVSSYRFADGDCAFLNPKRSLQVLCGQKRLGVLGEFHPEYGGFEAGQVFLFELDFSAVLACGKEERKFTPLQKFPGSARDLTVVVPKRMRAIQVFDVIESFQGELLQRAELLNVYIGSPIEEGCKSMAFSLFYQSRDKTLIDEEVDRFHNKIAECLVEKLGVVLR